MDLSIILIKLRAAGGMIALGFLSAVFLVGTLFQFHKIQHITSLTDAKMAELRTQAVVNSQAFEQIDFYEVNKEQIDSVWDSVNSGLPGPRRIEDLPQLQNLGKAQVKAKFNEETKMPGFILNAEEAEFQPVETALAEVEGQYPLLQVTRLEMHLPPNVGPMQKNPTYLTTEVELMMPR